MKPGTPYHRDAFCRAFIDTHVAFEPEKLPWPTLDPATLSMLRAFPFWSYARSIEARSGRMVELFAQTLDDPLIKEAVNIQAVEEYRHERLMAHVLSFYGIDAPEFDMGEPRASREDFFVFGFGECSDVFIGLGAFALARDKRVFPEPLLAIFEQLLFEEARHVVFFTNWWRYEQTRAGLDRPIVRTLQAIKYHAKAAMGSVGNAPRTPMPKLEGKFAELFCDVTPARFLEVALTENRRVMSRIDARLLKPALMPKLATIALCGIRMLPPRRQSRSTPEATSAGVREPAAA